MAGPYASVADLTIELQRTLTTAQAERATILLAWAGKLIDLQVPNVAARVLAGTLDVDLLKMVSVAMVARTFRAPGGIKSETIGPKSVVYDTALEAGLYLTASELALLGLPAESPPDAGARSIRLDRPAWWCR
jgi:hypothetical protein